MSKAVLISVRPKWCEKIVTGEKTIEVRKTRPKLNAPFGVYIYCTLPKYPHEDFITTDYPKLQFYGGGKVIGEFVCDRIYDLAPLNRAPDDVEQQACLTREEIVRYLKGVGYGWHVSDLKIYDAPRELGELRRACPNNFYCESCAMYRENDGTCGNESLQIKQPPQSWCYVEEM